MAKDAYYFSHDANARNDEKILMLMAEHGWEGYGIFWGLLEMMFENEETSLKHKNLKGIAVRYNIDITMLSSVIDTAIAEQLFVSDGVSFWSESLRLRKKEFHKSREQKSLAGKKGMEKRWGKKNKDIENTDLDNGVITDDITNNNDVITESSSDITENNKGKESKVKEIKVKDIDKTPLKKHYADNVTMTEEEYSKLIAEYGESLIRERIIDLDLWKGSKGKKTKSDYMTIKAWIRKDQKEVKPQTKPNGIKEIPKNPRRREDF